jgi:hypothetical protein
MCSKVSGLVKRQKKGSEDGRVNKEEVGGRQLAGGRTQNANCRMRKKEEFSVFGFQSEVGSRKRMGGHFPQLREMQNDEVAMRSGGGECQRA